MRLRDFVSAQDVAKYVREQIVPKAPSLEFSMIALAGGFPKDGDVPADAYEYVAVDV
jgi:hypothetical protein